MPRAVTRIGLADAALSTAGLILVYLRFEHDIAYAYCCSRGRDRASSAGSPARSPWPSRCWPRR